ncbi:MAG: hypothetical protein GY749_38650 [Desulfobacteraceae bacterium]|nr:hypothetical protein [Desulfobacteraceae bacterium]
MSLMNCPVCESENQQFLIICSENSHPYRCEDCGHRWGAETAVTSFLRSVMATLDSIDGVGGEKDLKDYDPEELVLVSEFLTGLYQAAETELEKALMNTEAAMT